MNISEIIASYKGAGLTPTAEAFAALVDACEALEKENAEIKSLFDKIKRLTALAEKINDERSEMEVATNGTLNEMIAYDLAERAEAERDRLKAERIALMQSLEEANYQRDRENTRYKAEIAKDRAVMCQQEKDNASLADRLSGAELERDALGAERDRLRAENDGLTKQKAAFFAEFERLRVECERLKATLLTVKGNCEVWNRLAHDRTDELKDSRAAHYALAEKNRDLEARVDALLRHSGPQP